MNHTDFEKLYQTSVEMMSFNNQLKLLKDQFLDTNIMYTQGSQFTVDTVLLQFCKTYIDLHRVKDVILLDNFRNPVLILDLQLFYDDAWNLYQKNLNEYYSKYQNLVESRGKI